MSEMIKDFRAGKEKEFNPVDARDILNDKDRPEIGELFQTYCRAMKVPDTVIAAMQKEDKDLSAVEKRQVNTVLGEFNNRIENADNFLSYLQTSGLYKDVSESIPVDAAYFETFVRGMAVRNPNNVDELIGNISAIQAVGQNKEKMQQYNDAKKELLDYGQKLGLMPKQVLGIAKLKTPDQRETAISALLAGTTDTSVDKIDRAWYNPVRAFMPSERRATVQAGEKMKTMMEKVVSFQSNLGTSFANLESQFKRSKITDEEFVDRIQTFASAKKDRYSFEEARNEVSSDALYESMKKEATRFGANPDEVVSALKAIPDGADVEAAMKSAKVRNAAGNENSIYDLYDKAISRQSDGIKEKGLLHSLVEKILLGLIAVLSGNKKIMEEVVGRAKK